MTLSLVKPTASNVDYADNKHRCIFCDKACKNKERLLAHQRVCEITTFNILHNFHTKCLPTKCFKQGDKVLINGKLKPMRQINIYEDMIPYDTHFVNNDSDEKESENNSETSNTFCPSDTSDFLEIELDEDDIITNEIEIDHSEKFHSTIDTEEEECINCIQNEEGKCEEHMSIEYYEEIHNDEIFLDNLESMINDMKSNMECQSKLYDEMLEEKKNIENKVEELIAYDSDESEEDEPFYFVNTKDSMGIAQKDFYTKDGIYCDPEIYNPELAEWKIYYFQSPPTPDYSDDDD